MGKNMLLITGTVTSSGNESIEIYNKVIEICQQYSDNISSPLDTMQFEGNNEERYKRAMALLQQTKLIIAEMSIPSTGQGMELQEAVRLNIPIIIIAKEGSKISGLLLGTHIIKKVIYYKDIESLQSQLKEALDDGF